MSCKLSCILNNDEDLFLVELRDMSHNKVIKTRSLPFGEGDGG